MKTLTQIQAEIAAEQAAILDNFEGISPYGEVSALRLLNRGAEQIDCLLDPIFPRAGVAALVGSSDSGKSTLLRGLAMAVATGQELYLNFRLRALHRSAIYVSTEDDQNSIASLLKRQNTELQLPTEAYEGLRFVFDTENLVSRLDRMLTDRPADLVVVDAFADIYTGGLNENNQVRGFLQLYHTLAQKHNCLVLFLHHTGKRTESLTPSKHNAIGSQGFEAKMRLMIELRRDPRPGCEHLRHLCIVKGNYLPPTFKNSSFELLFTEYLNYRPTGNRVPFNALREQTDDDQALKAQMLQVQELLEAGVSKSQIAKQLGIPRTTLISRIQNWQIPPEEQISPEDECPF